MRHIDAESQTLSTRPGVRPQTFSTSRPVNCVPFLSNFSCLYGNQKIILRTIYQLQTETHLRNIHFVQIWYVIEVFRFIRKNIHFLLFYFLYTKDFLNIKLRRVRIMIFSINRGFENDQNLTSKLFDDFGKIKFHPWYSNFEILHFWSSTIIFQKMPKRW